MELGNYLILGASGGIGRATCEMLVAGGANLMLAGRNQASLEALADDLAMPFQVLDASSIESVGQCGQATVEKFGALNGVVNCVGSLLLKSAHRTSPEEWDATIAANLTSAFAAVRIGAELMRDGGGSIVLMSSAAASTGLANHEAIAAAKAGVVGLMRSAAASYAGNGIRVNAVAPGLVKTGLTERLWSNEKSEKASRRMHPLGRLGEPEDIASLIVWLLQPENSWITGQAIGVDGGLAALQSGI